MTRKSATPSPALPLETYRGSVNAWECDENLHMNVRFFASRAMEGLAFLAAAMEMPGAFKERASSTLLPLDMHVRFLKEARQGAPLSMRGGILALGEDEAVAYQELLHADGTPAATFTTRVAHIEPQQMRRFPWSEKTRTRAAALMCSAPAHGMPRSIDMSAAPRDPKAAFAESIGATVVGRLAVTPDHCDPFGRMRMELFLGRVSDAVPNLLAGWRTEAAKAAAQADGVDKTAGAAVLEYRMCPRRWPRAGDLLEVRSGVVEVAEKTNRLVHWLFDPVTGDAWCTAEAVAVTFDLVTRKTIAIPQAQRKALEAKVVREMTI
ncbi:MAG: thioesterase family protein [Alphaproteobacteria bacterium]|nr:thioesterase family protein [Alphaproteobacteria bacterium]